MRSMRNFPPDPKENLLSIYDLLKKMRRDQAPLQRSWYEKAKFVLFRFSL